MKSAGRNIFLFLCDSNKQQGHLFMVHKSASRAARGPGRQLSVLRLPTLGETEEETPLHLGEQANIQLRVHQSGSKFTLFRCPVCADISFPFGSIIVFKSDLLKV